MAFPREKCLSKIFIPFRIQIKFCSGPTFLGQICSLAKMHMVSVHASFRVFASPGVFFSSAVRDHFVLQETNPVFDCPFGLEAVLQFVQMDYRLFGQSPRSFDEDVVETPTVPIHGDFDISFS